MQKVSLPFEEGSFSDFLLGVYHMSTRTKPKGGVERLGEYLTFSIFSMFAFALIYCLCFTLCDSILFRSKTSLFQKMSSSKKAEYAGRLVSTIHALICVATSTIGCFFIW